MRVEAVVAAQLKPDGGRSRLLSRRSRASTTPAGRYRQAVPRTDVTVLGQRLPLRLAKRSLRRRQLGRCCNSSDPLASSMPEQTYASTGTLAATLQAQAPARLVVSQAKRSSPRRRPAERPYCSKATASRGGSASSGESGGASDSGSGHLRLLHLMSPGSGRDSFRIAVQRRRAGCF